jgi:putative tryptophan/tyrosine transport system substrate-binding protein
MTAKQSWATGVLIFFVCLTWISCPAWAKTYKIGVVQIVSHPALDADSKGFVDALAAAGFVEGKNVAYDFQNAQGDMANAITIARKFVMDKVDLIHAIATPTSQACVKAAKTIPIVFSSVTDPVAAGLIKSWQKPGGNVTGISDMNPIAMQLKFFLEIVPTMKRVGFLYNSGETNSVVQLEQFQKAAEKLGVKTVPGVATTSTEVGLAASSLVGRVDAYYTPMDNTVVSALESVVKAADTNKIPLFVGDISSVPRGGLAALGVSYYDVGFEAGKLAVEILNGKDAGTIPASVAKNYRILLNLDSARAQNVTIPAPVLEKAEKIFLTENGVELEARPVKKK